MRFAVIYSPGPSWLPGRKVLEQPLGEHFDYMVRLHREGKAPLGGPFADETGPARALAILEAPDYETAARLVAEDPIVRQGIARAELHPWQEMLTQ